MRATTSLLLILFCATTATAQPAAVLRVTHDDPDGIVTPGQIVNFTVLMDWNVPDTILWRVMGDAVATPDVGVASSPAIGLYPPPSIATILNPGVASAGSVLGMEILSSYVNQLGFPVSPPWNQSSNVPLLRYEWTAPDLAGQTIDFDWRPSPLLPMPQLIMAWGNLSIFPVQTTYLGTTLTVIPAAPTLALPALAALTLRPRRKRPFHKTPRNPRE